MPQRYYSSAGGAAAGSGAVVGGGVLVKVAELVIVVMAVVISYLNRITTATVASGVRGRFTVERSRSHARLKA